MYNIVYVSFILLDIHSRSLRLIAEESESPMVFAEKFDQNI